MYLEPLTPAKNPKHKTPWWPRNLHSSTECRPSILLHKTEIKFIKKTRNTGKHTDCLAQRKPLPINAADYQLALIIRNPIYSGFFSVVVFLFLFSLFFSFFFCKFRVSNAEIWERDWHTTEAFSSAMKSPPISHEKQISLYRSKGEMAENSIIIRKLREHSITLCKHKPKVVFNVHWVYWNTQVHPRPNMRVMNYHRYSFSTARARRESSQAESPPRFDRNSLQKHVQHIHKNPFMHVKLLHGF